MASKEFALNKNILTVDSSEKISISLSTDADVLSAIEKNAAFPRRDSGTIDLTHINIEADANKTVKFNAGKGSVAFQASAGFRTGMGVFDKASDALASLQVQAPPEMDLALPEGGAARHLLMLWGYSASASAEGSHPIGVLGTVTFGVETARDGVYAVLHRFPADTGARDAIGETVSSWCLPRHFAEDPSKNEIKAGTWLIAETNGSIGIKIGAQLGYDFNLVRELNLLGIKRELGAKIDAGVKATFGFDVSGKYLVVLGRESNAKTARLRLFKQDQKGLSFGLNLSVGVTGIADLPDKVDDLVQGVFGVHGQQVLKDLHKIEDWLDKNKDLSDTVAGLVNKTGLDLLRNVTGLDPQTEFDNARKVVLGALAKWDALPAKTSAALWSILADLDEKGTKIFKDMLTALSNPNEKERASALAKELETLVFGPKRQWLTSIAERGLLALSSQLNLVRDVASQTLDVLNGGLIKRLQDFISDRLNLDKIRSAVTKNDFDALDGWLVQRISHFLDEKFEFEKLDTVKDAIEAVLKKRHEIYDKALKALKNRYSVEFAVAYQKNTTSTALLDVEFDLATDAAQKLLKEVVVDSNMDRLFVDQVAGVVFHQAMMSHEIKREATVQLHMPFFDFKQTHVNESLAKIAVEEDGGRVLAYEFDSRDKVKVENRFKSEFSILGAFRQRPDGDFALSQGDDKIIAYQSLQIKKDMKLADFEHRVTPFIDEYLSTLFGGGPASLNTFYLDLDRAVEDATHNGTNEFGDVGLSMQVTMTADVLGAWLKLRSDDELKRAQMEMSRRIQKKFKQLLPFYFFQETDKLRSNPTAAALLVWAAIPPSTSVKLDGDQLTFNTDNDVFWNSPDTTLRRAMASNSVTQTALVPALLVARNRLREIGDEHNASFFTSDQASTFQSMATSGMGETLLSGLLFTEAEIVNGAAKALEEAQELVKSAAHAPSETVVLLAEFGARLTSTFNEKIKQTYGDDSLRTLGSMIFLEASAAIDSQFRTIKPSALLSVTVLKEDATFELGKFLAGEVPPREQVAVAQNLVSIR